MPSTQKYLSITQEELKDLRNLILRLYSDVVNANKDMFNETGSIYDNATKILNTYLKQGDNSFLIIEEAKLKKINADITIVISNFLNDVYNNLKNIKPETSEETLEKYMRNLKTLSADIAFAQSVSEINESLIEIIDELFGLFDFKKNEPMTSKQKALKGHLIDLLEYFDTLECFSHNKVQIGALRAEIKGLNLQRETKDFINDTLLGTTRHIARIISETPNSPTDLVFNVNPISYPITDDDILQEFEDSIMTISAFLEKQRKQTPVTPPFHTTNNDLTRVIQEIKKFRDKLNGIELLDGKLGTLDGKISILNPNLSAAYESVVDVFFKFKDLYYTLDDRQLPSDICDTWRYISWITFKIQIHEILSPTKMNDEEYKNYIGDFIEVLDKGTFDKYRRGTTKSGSRLKETIENLFNMPKLKSKREKYFNSHNFSSSDTHRLITCIVGVIKSINSTSNLPDYLNKLSSDLTTLLIKNDGPWESIIEQSIELINAAVIKDQKAVEAEEKKLKKLKKQVKKSLLELVANRYLKEQLSSFVTRINGIELDKIEDIKSLIIDIANKIDEISKSITLPESIRALSKSIVKMDPEISDTKFFENTISLIKIAKRAKISKTTEGRNIPQESLNIQAKKALLALLSQDDVKELLKEYAESVNGIDDNTEISYIKVIIKQIARKIQTVPVHQRLNSFVEKFNEMIANTSINDEAFLIESISQINSALGIVSSIPATPSTPVNQPSSLNQRAKDTLTNLVQVANGEMDEFREDINNIDLTENEQSINQIVNLIHRIFGKNYNDQQIEDFTTEIWVDHLNTPIKNGELIENVITSINKYLEKRKQNEILIANTKEKITKLLEHPYFACISGGINKKFIGDNIKTISDAVTTITVLNSPLNIFVKTYNVNDNIKRIVGSYNSITEAFINKVDSGSATLDDKNKCISDALGKIEELIAVKKLNIDDISCSADCENEYVFIATFWAISRFKQAFDAYDDFKQFSGELRGKIAEYLKTIDENKNVFTSDDLKELKEKILDFIKNKLESMDNIPAELEDLCEKLKNIAGSTNENKQILVDATNAINKDLNAKLMKKGKKSFKFNPFKMLKRTKTFGFFASIPGKMGDARSKRKEEKSKAPSSFRKAERLLVDFAKALANLKAGQAPGTYNTVYVNSSKIDSLDKRRDVNSEEKLKEVFKDVFKFDNIKKKLEEKDASGNYKYSDHEELIKCLNIVEALLNGATVQDADGNILIANYEGFKKPTKCLIRTFNHTYGLGKYLLSAAAIAGSVVIIAANSHQTKTNNNDHTDHKPSKEGTSAYSKIPTTETEIEEKYTTEPIQEETSAYTIPTEPATIANTTQSTVVTEPAPETTQTASTEYTEPVVTEPKTDENLVGIMNTLNEYGCGVEYDDVIAIVSGTNEEKRGEAITRQLEKVTNSILSNTPLSQNNKPIIKELFPNVDSERELAIDILAMQEAIDMVYEALGPDVSEEKKDSLMREATEMFLHKVNGILSGYATYMSNNDINMGVKTTIVKLTNMGMLVIGTYRPDSEIYVLLEIDGKLERVNYKLKELTVEDVYKLLETLYETDFYAAMQPKH